MIKSLYVRIVLMFLAAIIVSLVASAMITGYIYEKSVQEQTEKYLVTLGQSLIRVMERTGFNDRALVMSDIKDLIDTVSVEIYDENLNLETYGAKPIASIDEERIRRALKGEVIHGSLGHGDVFAGLSFKHQGHTYALFLQPNSSNEPMYPTESIILTMIGIVMVGGSLFFIVEAAFLISPLRKMTEATRRMAKGDFNANLKVRRKDELGVLVRSFDEMRQQLQQIEQMRQDFVSNVSHEIQSPLTSIRGFARALKEDGAVDPKDRERYLDIIIAESERMSRMSDNLLKLASLESEHHPFHPETFRIDEQIRQTAVAFEPQWSAKSLIVDLQLPIVKITGDRDQLGQVWTNLLGNSIRFTPDGGQITISIHQEVDHVVVKFQDTGIGISAEDQSHIFERFYKADRSRSRIQGGNGLGLAIVKRIVDLHHGNIAICSEVGRGTEITVTLPYHSFKP
ncbi:ATP-binding protein [Paenibacillus puldeungensis]|uniref:Heme sensor protein HssS n=1 Tax=Paenibacillus puldeungensis TaxID=696536 RepID=A0ABW3RXA2_9BACL